MNLKEAFRYQNKLESLMGEARLSIETQTHCLTTIKRHLKSKANQEAKDDEEIVETDPHFCNDDVIEFMDWLIGQREHLTMAINAAKSSLDIDLDASIETNKFRQAACSSIRRMLSYSPSKRIERGTDYRFNVEGNQTPYVYDVEVETKDAFDREMAKSIMRDTIKCSDEVSSMIDAAMINTTVDYKQLFDVNDSFEDVMASFIDGMDGMR